MQDKGFITTRQLNEQLKSIPDNEKAIKVLELLKSNEIEGYNSSFTPANVVENAWGSAVDYVKNIWHFMTSPLQATDIAPSLIGGLVSKAIPADSEGAAQRKAELEKSFKEKTGRDYAPTASQTLAAVQKGGREAKQEIESSVNYFADRYGGADRIKETIERDPVGFVSDVSALMTGGLKTFSKGASRAGFAKTAEVANKVKDFAASLEPTQAPFTVARGLSGLAKKGSGAAGISLKEVSLGTAKEMNAATGLSSVFDRAARRKAGLAFEFPSNDTYKRLKGYFGKDLSDIATEVGYRGTPDDILAQAKNAKINTMKYVDDALGKIDTKVKSATVHNVLLESVKNLEKVKGLKSERLTRVRNELKIALEKHSGRIVENKIPSGKIPDDYLFFGSQSSQIPPGRINIAELNKFPATAGSKSRFVHVFKKGENISQFSKQGGEAVRALPELSFEVPIGATPEQVHKMALGKLGITKTVKNKIPGEGLTLSEMNEVRRVYDDLFSSKVYTQGGKVKQNLKALDLEGLSNQFRSVLYREAQKNGFNDLRNLNHQTMFHKFVEENIPTSLDELKARISRIETKNLWEAVSMNPVANTVRSMKFRTSLAYKLAMLSERDFTRFLIDVQGKRLSAQSKSVLRKMFKELQPAFPEFRLIGELEKEDLKRMSNKELKQRSDEVGLGALIEQMEQRR